MWAPRKTVSNYSHFQILYMAVNPTILSFNKTLREMWEKLKKRRESERFMNSMITAIRPLSRLKLFEKLSPPLIGFLFVIFFFCVVQVLVLHLLHTPRLLLWCLYRHFGPVSSSWCSSSLVWTVRWGPLVWEYWDYREYFAL